MNKYDDYLRQYQYYATEPSKRVAVSPRATEPKRPSYVRTMVLKLWRGIK